MSVSWRSGLIGAGGLGGAVVLALGSSFVYVLGLLGAVLLGWVAFRVVPGGAGRLAAAAATGLLVLSGVNLVWHPAPVQVPMPPAAVEPGLAIPPSVLSEPTNVNAWLYWAKTGTVTSETDTGMVALDQGLLAHPDGLTPFAADLAVNYAILADGNHSWTESLMARYYGIEGKLVPALPFSAVP